MPSEWGGDYPADQVVYDMAEFNSEIDTMLDYLTKLNGTRNSCGFECHVDTEKAKIWLREHRPTLLGFIEWAENQEDTKFILENAANDLKGSIFPGEYYCDNTHQQNGTVCRWCWYHGRHKWDDPEVTEEDNA